SDETTPSGVAPPGKNAALLPAQACRKIASEAVLGKRSSAHLLLALHGDLGLLEEQGGPHGMLMRQNLRHHWSPETPRALPAWVRRRVVELLSEVNHQAAAASDVV